jgi:hypothetical protein
MGWSSFGMYPAAGHVYFPTAVAETCVRTDGRRNAYMKIIFMAGCALAGWLARGAAGAAGRRGTVQAGLEFACGLLTLTNLGK